MSNTLLTIDMITNEALDIFHNKCVLARNSNRQFDNQFGQQGSQIGANLRVRMPVRYTVTTGATMSAQNTVEEYATIPVATRQHVAMDFTSEDLTLKLSDFSAKIIAPAMATLASAVDLNGHQTIYKAIGNSVGTPGSTPSSALTLLQANAKLSNFAVPEEGRNFIMNPAANAAMVDGAKGLFNPGGVLDAQYKKGKLGSNILGFEEIAMSQNVANHTTGDWGTTITVTPTATEASSTIGIQFTGSSKTWKIGDVFTVANVYSINQENYQSTGELQQFVVTAELTASSTGNLTVFPPLITTGSLQTINRLPTANDVVTMLGSAATVYPQNLAYQKDSVAFVTADLVMPQGGQASRKVMDGISMRVWRQSDIFNDLHPCRVDVLYGWKMLRPLAGCRVWG